MENEKRLIDANALLEAIDKSDRDNLHNGVANRSCHHYEHIHFMNMVLNAPSVDAVEVVHSKWNYDGSCRHCGVHVLSNYMYYCPNCGAKMDKEN